MMFHHAAATWTATPELEIDEDEATGVCKAGDDVLAFYNKIPSPELQVWFGLIAALGMVYGPRVVAIRLRLKREAEERAKRAVVNIRQVRPEDVFPPREPVA